MTYKLLPEMITVINIDNCIPISDIECGDGVPRSVLWQRDGLFRLIPKSVIINLSDAHRTKHNLPIRWDQGADVDPKIAHILLGE
jgi:hypothetical protein